MRLKESEPLETALRRLAVEGIDEALAALDGDQGQDVMVHSLRKQLKQLRALLRLFRYGMGEEYAREILCFRDLGRALSAARDGAVALDVHASLVERFGARLYASVGAEVRQLLIRDLQVSCSRRGPYSRYLPDTDTLRAQLLAARTRCRRWKLGDGSDAVLERGLRQTYRRGRRAALRSCRSQAAEDMHRLRRRAKDYWYQLEFVARRWPDFVLRRAARVRRLTQLLGEIQDLVIYCTAIERAAAGASPEAIEILEALAERRRRGLEAEALDLAQVVYETGPKQLLLELRERGRLQHAARGA